MDKSKYESALDAGYSETMARNAKEKTENRRLVPRALDRWLHKEALSDRALGIES
jgi:hypothetical protein